MERQVRDQEERVLRVEDAEPTCGEDFCEACGDCLHCYGGDDCLSNSDGRHFWIIYEGQPVEDALP